MKMVVTESCYKKLKELRNLLSHRNPNLSYGEMLSILSEEALKKYDPRRRRIRQNKLKSEASCILKQETALSGKTATSAEKLATAKGKSVNSVEKLVTAKGKSATSVPKSVSPTRRSVALAEQLISDKGKPVTSAPKSAISASQRRKNKIITRRIPSHLRKYIWERDKGQCTYVHHKTNRRCLSKHLLQIDHIQPFALGGKGEKENLRLLCAGHNRFRLNL